MDGVAGRTRAGATTSVRLGPLLAVLGVVYGDIGTSPLYAFKACLDLLKGGSLVQEEILGLLSLIFWALILIVTVKYVILVMRADNRGEGGILALMVLAQRVSTGPRTRAALALVGTAGACLLFGDGVITPAISVLSAVEGLEVSAPGLKTFVLPISVAVIVGLFAMQYRGTGIIGRVFGPVMALWFAVIGALGATAIARHPAILAALSPHHAIEFGVHHGWLAFVALGSVVLAVTGAEALYADMGHFGAKPIRLSWLFFVLPCLTLNYLGQGALVLGDVGAAENPFYLLAPDWLRLPLVILATLATVIASQALISGAFSITRQCMQLHLLPRMTVRHTSEAEEGQIYVPQVNMALAVGVLVLVVAFRTSDALASAYGIAVTGTFLCTAVLAAIVFHGQFGWPRWAAFSVFGSFLAIDGLFFGANMLKVLEGGWVPLAFAGALMALMTSWEQGRELILAQRREEGLALASFVARLPQSRILRVPGTAVFLTGDPRNVPAALLHNLKHNQVLHERALCISIGTLDVPEAEPSLRGEVEDLGAGIYRVGLRFGFMEEPNVPRALEALTAQGALAPLEAMRVSYFLNRPTVVSGTAPQLPAWRRLLFRLMERNASSGAEFLRIPADRVVELGVRIAL